MINHDESGLLMRVILNPCKEWKLVGAQMTVESPQLLNFDSMSKQRTRSHQPRRPHSMAEMKARQATKIRGIAEALVSAGFVSLDAQARALGVGRSTAWTILKSSHKASGLSAKIINRILANH